MLLLPLKLAMIWSRSSCSSSDSLPLSLLPQLTLGLIMPSSALPCGALGAAEDFGGKKVSAFVSSSSSKKSRRLATGEKALPCPNGAWLFLSLLLPSRGAEGGGKGVAGLAGFFTTAFPFCCLLGFIGSVAPVHPLASTCTDFFPPGKSADTRQEPSPIMSRVPAKPDELVSTAAARTCESAAAEGRPCTHTCSRGRRHSVHTLRSG